MKRPTPAGAVARGLLAGAAGTAAMTASQELAMRLRDSGGQEAGGGAPADPWEQASTPAKVARRVLEGVFHQPVPPARIGMLTQVTHWAYGTGWGAVYGLVEGTSPASPLRRGVLFGAGVGAMSYLQLIPMGLYAPPWKYPPQDVALELSYHLAYCAGVGAGWSVVGQRRR